MGKLSVLQYRPNRGYELLHVCMIAPMVSKTALSEQKQDSLNTSVSVVALEMQHSHSKSISLSFLTLLPTNGGMAAGDVAQHDASNHYF